MDASELKESVMNRKQTEARLSFCGRVTLVLGILCVIGMVAHSEVLDVLNRFQGGQPISAMDVNNNFETVADWIGTQNSRMDGYDTALQNAAEEYELVAERLTAIEGQLVVLRNEVTDLQEFKINVERGECPGSYVRVIDGSADPGCAAAVDNGNIESTNSCTREYSAWTVCEKELADGYVDEIVKIGDFWIDRYEMADCGDRNLGDDPTGYTTIGIPCSRPGAEPYHDITWYQATQACANAGKHLCTNAEWQTAASGTPDPGDGLAIPDGSDQDNACNVANNAGQGSYSAARGNPARARAHLPIADGVRAAISIDMCAQSPQQLRLDAGIASERT